MTFTLEVYDPTNVTHQGTLAKAYGIGWSEELRGPGALVFSLDLAQTADRALLPPGSPRVIRINDGTTDIEAFVVRDTPSELVSEDEVPFLRYQCEQLISVLGYSRGGALLRPHGDLDGLQQNPRWFGPMGWDFIERVGIPEPTTGGAPTRENWMDPRGERFVFTSRAVYRRVLTGSGISGDPSRMFFTAAQWTDVRVWFDGVELEALNSGVGDRSIRTLDLVTDGLDHVICFDCHGDPPPGRENSLVWTWGVIEDDANGEPNIWDIANRMFTTFNSTTYTGPTAPSVPYWQAWEDYADGDYPGVTNGYVSNVALAEAQARGLLPGITTDCDELVDSDGVDWEQEYAHAFDVQRLGPLHDQLGAWKCEPEMTPAGLLRLHQRRGTDRGATPDVGATTVTINARSLSATGQGPKATRYLTKTEGGFGEVIDAAAELALGVALEDFVSLGNDIHPHSAAAVVALQLEADATVRNDLEAELPGSIVPHDDVFLGDVVQAISDADLTVADVRIVGLRCELSDEDNVADWTAILEPA